MEKVVNTCLNQSSYWRYDAAIEEHQLVKSNLDIYPNPLIQFHVGPKSNPIHILVKEEMLIIDSIDLFGNLGGLLGLFVGFSFFGYSSPLIDFIFTRIHARQIIGNHWNKDLIFPYLITLHFRWHIYYLSLK